jgi:hypothetical protein
MNVKTHPISPCIVALLVLLLPGCAEPVQPASFIPMVKKPSGQGPWQVVTYDNERIIHDDVKLLDGRIEQTAQTVYIAHNSQYVYKNGDPIVTYANDTLYWHSHGEIVNQAMKVIPEFAVFKVKDNPMPRHTAMMLKHIYLDAQRSIQHKTPVTHDL